MQVDSKVGMKRFLIILLFFFCGCIAADAQKTYVVSVGIADYKDPQINDLSCTENDVEIFNDVMKRHTREVYTLLGRNATHRNTLNTIRTVFSKATSKDAVILYFSGHGYPGGFCCYDMTMSMTSGGLSYTEIASLFKACKAGNKIVFADACFSGGLRREKKPESSISSIRNSEVMFFLSSRTNEVSQEMIGGPNGQFTRFLVRGLGGGADKDRNKKISARELYDFVHDGVTTATADKQHPVMWGHFNNSMTILDWSR